MNTKGRNAARAAGSIVSAGWIGAVTQQFISGPSEKAREIFEAIIDIQSIYVGLIIIGIGSFLYFNWPYVIWCVEFKKRRRHKKAELLSQQASLLSQQANEVRDLILRLLQDGTKPILERLDTPDELGHHEGIQLGADIAITLRRLGELGFARPDGVSGEDWLTMLNQVYRYNEQYGVKAARCVMAQLIEDHMAGTIRTVSHQFRIK